MRDVIRKAGQWPRLMIENAKLRNALTDASDTATHAIVMLAAIDRPWDELDVAERAARAENELRYLLDRLGELA